MKLARIMTTYRIPVIIITSTAAIIITFYLYSYLFPVALTTWNDIKIEIDTSKFRIYNNNTEEFQIGFKEGGPKGTLIYMRSNFTSTKEIKDTFKKNGATILSLERREAEDNLVQIELITRNNNYIFEVINLTQKYTFGYIGPKENYHFFAPIMEKSISSQLTDQKTNNL